ncbi:MAG: PIN domain-containing protein [Lachnospiraceae bacterium]|nr:PIN domain-containing protein [Lachnospiraceae bacterium]
MFEFLADCNIRIYPIEISIAKKAAQIRAEYKDFKTMDCLQLATACQQKCDLFLTNDKQLRQFNELKCMTIEDF